MTAFALRFDRQRIVIATDTLAYVPRRAGEAMPIGFTSKVIPIPHLRCALFARGMMQITVEAAAAIMLSAELADFEAVAGALPAMLQQAAERYADRHDIDDRRDLFVNETVLAGWDRRQQRMRMVYFLNAKDYEPQDDGGAYYGRILTMPNLPAEYLPRAAGIELDRQLVEHLKGARRWFADAPEMMNGALLSGDVIVTEITPNAIAQRVVYRFEDADERGHAAAAVAARIIREGVDEIDVAAGLTPTAEAVDTAAADPDAARLSRAERRRAEKLARRAARAKAA